MGTFEENEAIRVALEQRELPVPIHVLKPTHDLAITNTIGQIWNFRLPDDILINPGDKIALITHSPHFPRIFNMAEA